MNPLWSTLRTTLDYVEDYIGTELRAAAVRAQDEAHLATCGDRPFVGCGPCAPAPVESHPGAENAAAAPR
jgi:hypothetical protein